MSEDKYFKYKIGDKVLYKNWCGDVNKGKIIGCRAEVFNSRIYIYYAIKTLFDASDVNEDHIYGFIRG